MQPISCLLYTSVYGSEDGTQLVRNMLEEPLAHEQEIALMAAAYMKEHVKEG